MVAATNLGFPRMGANRELKRLVENFWSKKVDEKALKLGAKNLRAEHWILQHKSGLTQGHIPSNDFSFYDQVLDHIQLFGATPERYKKIEGSLNQYFAMARGMQDAELGVDVPAMEMKKWFDTNYHYIVPELSPKSEFSLCKGDLKPVLEFKEAKDLGIETRPVILGPISFLLSGKPTKSAPEGFTTLSLLGKLLEVYKELFVELGNAGVLWIQVDEPFLVLDQPSELKELFATAYSELTATAPSLKLLLTSYFGRVGANLDFVLDLPIHGLHLDLVRGQADLPVVLSKVRSDMVLSLGLINGRNVWKANLALALSTLQEASEKLGSKERIFVAPSCSMLHCPHGLERETKMLPEIKDWLSFSMEKVQEIVTLKTALASGQESVSELLELNRKSIASRQKSELIHRPTVRKAVESIDQNMMKRNSQFSKRVLAQQEKLDLPAYPTTTVGSFPQTSEIRVARAKFRKGEMSLKEYDEFIAEEMRRCIKFQENVGLDVLVHGEFERNDMVEYFGELLSGFVFSENGWVQSYGSRCVKPPIIYGDVDRESPMTVKYSSMAQGMTEKPMKGMLTGPVTMLQWSFVRDDQPRKDTTFQIALALRKEVLDLEKSGLKVIQIDEPAIREGLPLRKSDWQAYLAWAVNSFLIASTGVKDETQIHTHMCYSDFNDIFEAIIKLDADCITIENSKCDLKLLSAFEKHSFQNGVGPGLYDIHSPRVPTFGEIKERLKQVSKYVPSEILWVNPDCGLKTRKWSEVEAALTVMCNVAKEFRKETGKAFKFGVLPCNQTTASAVKV